MNGYALQNVKEEKEVGILIDDILKFHTHTSSVIKKANSILGLIKRSFSVLDENTLPRLYTSMVRPHLEYGNVIWGPHYKGNIKAIEKVQKRASKIVPSLKNLPYVRRQETLNLPSLVYRRKRGDMIMCFKMMSKQVNVDTETYFTMNNFKTRGHEYKILKTKRASKQARIQSFSIRTVNNWNSFPPEVVQEKSITQFKNLLDKHWEERKFESPFT